MNNVFFPPEVLGTIYKKESNLSFSGLVEFVGIIRIVPPTTFPLPHTALFLLPSFHNMALHTTAASCCCSYYGNGYQQTEEAQKQKLDTPPQNNIE